MEAGIVFDSAFVNADPMSSPFMKEGVPEKVIGTTGHGLGEKRPLHHLEMVFLPNVILEGVRLGGSCLLMWAERSLRRLKFEPSQGLTCNGNIIRLA